ncbi:DUF6470 family protein [Orenia marismortui]|uniref:DUF6470 family protein n=1 Tax=Orenia marismortui TaxID=46469 RepID=UPI00037814A9|nr:DUF6470 family protein [Orenia marismortui]
MKIPQLQINQTMGKIGMEWQRGNFEMNLSPIEVEIDYGNSKPFQVVSQPQIDNPSAELKIDNTKFLEDIEFRKFNSLVKHLRGLAKNKITQGIVEIAQEGDELSKIEDKGDKIAQLAKGELTDPKKEISLKVASSPSIKVETNSTNIKVNPAKIKVDSNSAFPEVRASGDKVEIYVEQKGRLEIEVVSNVDYQV